MLIESRDLAALIRTSSTCLIAGARERIETVIDYVAKANITASTASPESNFLHQAIDKYGDKIAPELMETLKGAEIFGAPVPIPNALARREATRPQIVVFDGMVHLIKFYGSLINTCSLLQTHRSDVSYDLGGEEVPEADLMMTAGHSIIADFVGGSCHTPVGLERILGPQASLNVQFGLESSILFILGHEAGHIALGHVDDQYPLSERPPDGLAYREDFDEYKEAELQADSFALKGMLDQFGDDVISSILFFLSPFSFIEAFAPLRAGDHPLTVNRARHLAALLSATGRASRVAIDIIENQADGIEKLAEQRRSSGGNILERIESSLPVRDAYTILNHIEERVLREHGPLEATQTPPP